MARVCYRCGKRPATGNNVSHAHNKTRRKFFPNIQVSSMPSEALGQSVKLKLSTQTIRTIEKNGGIDAYLLSTSNKKLSVEAQRLKRKIKLASGKAV